MTVSPKHDGGLLGSVELAWDATQGVPLEIGGLRAGRVAARARAPGDRHLLRRRLDRRCRRRAASRREGRRPRLAPDGHGSRSEADSKRSTASTQCRPLPFTVVAPPNARRAAAPGRSGWSAARHAARSSSTAQGLGGDAVVERKAGELGSDDQLSPLPTGLARRRRPPTSSRPSSARSSAWERDGVSYVLAGSMPAVRGRDGGAPAADERRRRRSSLAASSSATARSSRSTTSTSRSSRATSSAISARTARARRPRCGCCSA